MPKLTGAKGRILSRYIEDFELSNSLILIYGAMEGLCESNKLSLVKDDTCLEVEHSERVAAFVEMFLQANPNVNFSEREIYLLLANIFLQDIGIRCNFIKNPEVKKKAEELGAKFGVNFTVGLATRCSVKEIDEILKNRHFLSAAYISHLYEIKDELLYTAINTMPDPEYLLEDLIDVCKFDSKLSIDNCDIYSKFDPTCRKRLVAAFLNIINEIDRISSKVSVKALENFAYDNNKLRGLWLHNYTEVSIDSKAISLEICLHPENYDLVLSFVNDEYIPDFRGKINPFISILSVQNNIPLKIEYNVKKHDSVDKLPDEIVNIFNINSTDHIYNLPDRNSKFNGRKDILTEINEKLVINNSKLNPRPLLIYGDNNNDETQIAIEYAYKFYDEDKSRWVLWIDATSNETFLLDFTKISRLLDPNDVCEGLEAVNKVRNWMSNHSNWLLIYNNVNDLASLSRVTLSLLYPPQEHVIIVTVLKDIETFGNFELVKVEEKTNGKESDKFVPPSNIDDIERLYEDSIYGERIDHFRREKEILAHEVVKWVDDTYISNSNLKICLLIDSGTTTYQIFKEISSLVSKNEEKKELWKKHVCIVTNNLPGSQYLMVHSRRYSNKPRSGTSITCLLLPGKTLSAYAAIASDETIDWISLYMRSFLEKEWKCNCDDYKVISVISTNYVTYYNGENGKGFLPVARGKEHFLVKKAIISAGDEIIIISPLMKFSFASVNLLNTINKFIYNQDSDEAEEYPSQVKYKEILTSLNKTCIWFITTRNRGTENRKRIFYEFSNKLVEKLKLMYSGSHVYAYEYELEKYNNFDSDPDLAYKEELKLEIPHPELRENYPGESLWDEDLVKALENKYFPNIDSKGILNKKS